MAPETESKFVGVAVLSSLNANRELVEKEVLTIDDYYDDPHPMIDDDAFRKKHHIRFVNGRIYNYEGVLEQEYDQEYGKDGEFIRGRTVFADGTVIVD